jgi:hypothetical protein
VEKKGKGGENPGQFLKHLKRLFKTFRIKISNKKKFKFSLFYLIAQNF